MWFDATAVKGKLTGDRLTTFTDLSGNNNHLTATSLGALYDANSFFGRPTFNFNGVNTAMTAASRLVALTNISVFIVARYTSGRIIGVDNDTDGNNALAWLTTIWAIRTGGVNNDVAYGGQVANGTIFSLLLGTGGTAGSMSKCNAAAQTTGTGTAYTDAGVNFHLGSSGNNSAFFTGLVGEVAIYNTKLTEANRDNIHGYLNSKWGVF
jgi:hypothetical protein